MIKIGVLDYQGGVEEHYKLLSRLKGVKPVLVQYPNQTSEIDALIIPGGESTTLLRLLKKDGMDSAIIAFHKSGKLIWGTCAGLIVLSSIIINDKNRPLGLIDIEVERNGYGSQLDSFIVKKKIPLISQKPVELLFIRAPKIIRQGSEIKTLFEVEKTTVFAKSDTVLVSSFHPELTNSILFHKYFLKLVIDSIK